MKTKPIMLDRARTLRKNMTPEERKLWYLYLKPHPAKFYKQKVIGPYIVDFCCPFAKLIIELDGSQHYLEEGERYDKRRDKWLEGQGYHILRFSNYEINRQFIQVCDMIEGTVDERAPLRQPSADTSPKRGEARNQ